LRRLRKKAESPTLTIKQSILPTDPTSTRVSVFHDSLDSPVHENYLRLLDKGPKYNLATPFSTDTEVSILTGIANFMHQLKWRLSASNRPPIDNLHIPFDNKPSIPPPLPNALLEKTKAMHLKIKRLLNKEKTHTSVTKNQLTNSEINALRKMKEDYNIYMSSDKGGEFTIIGIKKYIELGEDHLSDTSTYHQLKRDTTTKVKNELNALWRTICTERQIPQHIQMKLSTQSCSTQNFYHQLKTHKTGYKIRPIVSVRNGPFDRLGWFLQLILKPLLDHVPSHLYNTQQLLNTLNNISPSEASNTKPISLDVKSMYTNIPIQEGIDTSIQYLRDYNCNLHGLSLTNIKQLLTHILTNNVFAFNNKFYVQTNGLAMGSRIAPLISIITLDRLERKTLSVSSNIGIKLFRRYVDDCFILLHKNTNPNKILNIFNAAHPSIKFELEKEDNHNSLNILDVNIKVSNDGLFSTKFFEKSAKKGIFINASSHISLQTKRAAISAEFQRIQSLCTSQLDKNQANSLLQNKLVQNGYKTTQINKFRQRNNRNTINQSSNINPIYFSIPFVSNQFQNKLKHIMNELTDETKIPFRIVNRSSNTLGLKLSKLNHKNSCSKRLCHVNNEKICLLKYTVYYAKCSLCISRQDYVGSSRQQLHDRAYQHYNSAEEAIHQHCRLLSHPGLPFKYNVLSRASSLKELLIKEALYINRLKPTLNRKHELEDVIRLID